MRRYPVLMSAVLAAAVILTGLVILLFVTSGRRKRRNLALIKAGRRLKPRTGQSRSFVTDEPRYPDASERESSV